MIAADNILYSDVRKWVYISVHTDVENVAQQTNVLVFRETFWKRMILFQYSSVRAKWL